MSVFLLSIYHLWQMLAVLLSNYAVHNFLKCSASSMFSTAVHTSFGRIHPSKAQKFDSLQKWRPFVCLPLIRALRGKKNISEAIVSAGAPKRYTLWCPGISFLALSSQCALGQRASCYMLWIICTQGSAAPPWLLPKATRRASQNRELLFQPAETSLHSFDKRSSSNSSSLVAQTQMEDGALRGILGHYRPIPAGVQSEPQPLPGGAKWNYWATHESH